MGRSIPGVLQVENNYDVIINNGPSRRPVFTGGQRCLCTPVIIRLVNTAVFTGARYTLPVFTGRVERPYSRVVWTGAREHGREHGCVPSFTIQFFKRVNFVMTMFIHTTHKNGK